MGETGSRLKAAERRLDDALARLERAVAVSRSNGGAAALNGGELVDALAEVRRQNDELKALSRDAASRLDQAIEQIDLLLED